MISFRLADEGNSIQVDCDLDGLNKLLSVLSAMAKDKRGHIHLRSPSAGGNLLSDTTPWGKRAIAEVIVSLGGDH